MNLIICISYEHSSQNIVIIHVKVPVCHLLCIVFTLVQALMRLKNETGIKGAVHDELNLLNPEK